MASRLVIAYSVAFLWMSMIILISAGFFSIVSALAPQIMLSVPIAVPYGYSTTLPTPLARLMPGPGSAPT